MWLFKWKKISSASSSEIISCWLIEAKIEIQCCCKLCDSEPISQSSHNNIIQIYASPFSRVWPFEMLWTVAHQAPLSMWIIQVGILEWVAMLPPGDLPDPGIKPTSLICPALTSRFFTTSATWEAQYKYLLFPNQIQIQFDRSGFKQ